MTSNDSGSVSHLTLEEHFKNLSVKSEDSGKLYSIWVLLKGDLEERLRHTQNIYVTFSLHDSSHSRSILRSIERFLGVARIAQLSLTDTFMLLVCAYAHDYGMALTIDDVFQLLSSGSLRKYIIEKNAARDTLEPEDAQAIRILSVCIRCESCEDPSCRDCPHDKKSRMESIYFALVMVIQMYARPEHWKGVERIEAQYKDLFAGRLNIRFVRDIIAICQAHGQDVHVLEQLEADADGYDGDVYHPRFIAAMLRLGDLLDVDNGRFPRWFFEARDRGCVLIPKLSELHFKKHESIRHIRILPEYIAITSSCRGGGDSDEEDAYSVAEIVAEWFDWIRSDCEYLSKNWAIIANGQFGAPPGELKLKIFVDGKPYSAAQQRLQMQMPQDRVLKLLEGTSIYQDRFVGIRELLQNAIDASLLQLWYDVTHNRYVDMDLHGRDFLHEGAKQGNDPPLPIWAIPPEIYDNYKIKVEVIWDKSKQRVLLVVKDKGIGITPEDVKFMVDIGTSKERNDRIRKIMRTMPDWLKPAGVFGIGLQSVFQLTNQIQFYTRRPNEPERKIIFFSYGRNRGKTEIREMCSTGDLPFYDNTPQGTNVVIELDIERLFPNGLSVNKKNALNFDPEFSPKPPLEAAYIMMSNMVREEIRSISTDYFSVSFQSMVLEDGLPPQKEKVIPGRYSFFAFEPGKKQPIRDKLLLYDLRIKKNCYSFGDTMAQHWDEKAQRFYRLRIQRCTIKNGQVSFPAPRTDLYRVLYKFNEISHVESIYEENHDGDYLLNMARVGMVSWDILIMDGEPTKYLNIDRDRLKEGSLYEEQLLKVKQDVMEKWCRYFVQAAEKRQTPEQQKKLGGHAASTPAETEPDPHLRFAQQQGTLVSLMLLFYRYAPTDLFQAFVKYYGEELEGLRIKGYDYELKRLWDGQSLFKTTYRFFGKKSTPHEAALPLAPDTVDLLTHRLFHIVNIVGIFDRTNYRFSRIQYITRIGGKLQSIEPINMSEDASLFDYVMAFDRNPSSGRLYWNSIIKKVFKPNEKFSPIIVPTYPQSFHYSGNFCRKLDRSIRGFILSPFDSGAINIFRRNLSLIRTGTRHPDLVWNSFNFQILKYMHDKDNGSPCSQQLYLCAQYVLKKQKEFHILPSNIDDQAALERILSTYYDFIQHFCRLIFEYEQGLSNRLTPNNEELSD